MNKYNISSHSLTQSAFYLVDELLYEYQQIQPSFKYKLYHGSNYDISDNLEKDVFNIVLFMSGVDKIPSHFVEINGEKQILFAGYFDILLSIVNPISTNYTDDLEMIALQDNQISYDLGNQSLENINDNILSEEDISRIELGHRLLEGLALFITQKNKEIDNFKFTTRADMPIIDGQYDIGEYRLTQSLGVSVKFALQNDLGKSLISGEDLKVWFKFLDEEGIYEDDWYELYNVLDFEIDTIPVSKQFPLSGHLTTQQMLNHLNRGLRVSAPELNIGASKKLKDILYSEDLRKMRKLKIRYYDGVVLREFEGVVVSDYRPLNLDRFASLSFTVGITSELKEIDEVM